MAPAQAKGKPADKRSDIWSFGVVRYEVLTDNKLFSGESAVKILSGVLNQDPDISAARTQTAALVPEKRSQAAVGIDQRRPPITGRIC
jgi:serine/threonine protein kinase